jgi:glycosyltransferase involved in cell wall biosynthesis
VSPVKLKYVSCNACGVWLYEKYAFALQRAGAEVELVEERFDDGKSVVDGIYARQVPKRRFGFEHRFHSSVRFLKSLERMALGFRKTGERRRLIRYLRSCGATHFVAADPWALELCALAQPSANAKVFYVPMEPFRHKIGVHEGRRREWRRLERRYMPRVAAAIYMGESIRSDYVAAYGGPAQSHVIYDSWPLALTAQPNGLSHSAGNAGNGVVILYCGQIEIPRGVTDLVSAMTRTPASSRLVFLGFGAAVEETRIHARQAAVNDRVAFHPAAPQRDLVGLMAGADVGVIPSRGEMSLGFGCPGKMFTYMAAGLPLVVSDCPDTRSLVTTHGLGEVFRPGDVADLARALNALITSDDYRNRCAQNSRRCNESIFCWELQSAKLAQIILQ